MLLVEPRPARPLPIRITPLIDVVFILLVFFMLTSHLLPTGTLELDNRSGATGSRNSEPAAELQLTGTGQVLWQERTWLLTELLPKLQSQGITEANLDTASDSRLSDFTRTLSALDNAGIRAHWQRDPQPQDESRP